MSKELSVVVVNYNVKYYVEQCLHALHRALEGVDAEVFVVDNHSRDRSVPYLQARFPEVRIIASAHNNGFAHANNVALKQCQGKFVLLLNPDTIVGENVIREMLAFVEQRDRIGGVGVEMIGADGQRAMESRRGVPSPMVSFYKMCGLCARFPRSRRFGKYYMGYLPWDEAAQIEVVSGACFLIRRSVLERIGLLDEDFFMYGEDIDLSCRILKAGFENWFLPCRILHYKGESTQKTSFRYVHVFYQAMLIFFRKHYQHLRFWLSFPIKAAIYTKAFTSLLSIQGQLLRKTLALGMKRRPDPFYLFIGGNDMLAKSRALAESKGLEADFVSGTQESLPDGHLSLASLPEKESFVVYDTSSFSYEKMLSLFSSQPMKNVSLGTFNPDTEILITHREVIQ